MTCHKCKTRLRPGALVTPIYMVDDETKYRGEGVFTEPVGWLHLTCPPPKKMLDSSI